MVAINFHAQFADAVLSGKKRQTIRKRGKLQPPRVGDVLQLYAGRAAGKLLDVVCTSVSPITIISTRDMVTMSRVGIFGVATWDELPPDECNELARAEGFSGVDDFFAFFGEKYGRTFSGYLIKW